MNCGYRCLPTKTRRAGAARRPGRPIRVAHCLVPEGRVIPQLAAWRGVADWQGGDAVPAWRLAAARPAIFGPGTYDHLLWACDLNFVRGQLDSCVRAQAGRRRCVAGCIRRPAGALGQAGCLAARYVEGSAPGGGAAVGDLWMLERPATRPPMAQLGSVAGQQGTIEAHARGWALTSAWSDGLSTSWFDF